MNESEETVVVNLMLLEAESKIDQLAKEVLALEAENQRLKRVIDEMIKPFITRL
jgi:cell division protein FtsB